MFLHFTFCLQSIFIPEDFLSSEDCKLLETCQPLVLLVKFPTSLNLYILDCSKAASPWWSNIIDCSQAACLH